MEEHGYRHKVRLEFLAVLSCAGANGQLRKKHQGMYLTRSPPLRAPSLPCALPCAPIQFGLDATFEYAMSSLSGRQGSAL